MISESRIPNGGGVYVLKLNQKVIYVGRTRNFAARIRSHRRKQFDAANFFRSSNPHFDEATLISKYKPSENKQTPVPTIQIAMNASKPNSDKIRQIQKDYERRFAPAKIALDAIGNLAIELGVDKVRMKLNLNGGSK